MTTTLAMSAALLVCLGLLLGAAWTTQALDSRFREQAEERRRLNEEWLAVHTARRQLAQQRPYRTGLPEPEEYHATTLVGYPPDDD